MGAVGLRFLSVTLLRLKGGGAGKTGEHGGAKKLRSIWGDTNVVMDMNVQRKGIRRG